MTRAATPARIIVVAAVVLSVLGCSLPGKPDIPPKRTYLLQAEASASAPEATGARKCLSLRVAVPAAAPGFDTARIAYVTQPPRLDYFAYHEWVDVPARMFASMMETRLDDSGLFGTVVLGSADIRTDLRLDSDLISLRQDFNGSASTLKLVMKVKLVDVSSRALLQAQTFSYAEAAADANPEAGVEAANRAAGRFLAELATFVAASIARIDCPPPG